jgi:outer membrane lipoprotein SlyB
VKALVYIGLFVGSTIGSWIGAAITGGNWFSTWSIILGSVGALAGIWAGYKVGRNYL